MDTVEPAGCSCCVAGDCTRQGANPPFIKLVPIATSVVVLRAAPVAIFRVYKPWMRWDRCRGGQVEDVTAAYAGARRRRRAEWRKEGPAPGARELTAADFVE